MKKATAGIFIWLPFLWRADFPNLAVFSDRRNYEIGMPFLQAFVNKQ